MNPVLACVAFCLASFAHAQEATAQGPAEKPDLKSKQALLVKACATMAELPSGAFTTELKSDSPMARAMRGAGGGGDTKTTVAGAWGQGLLSASCDDGADELVFAGRRMIARENKGAWKLRHGVLLDGRPLPAVIDPSAAFAVLAQAKLEVIHSEVGSFDDRPVEIVTARAEGDVARDLRHAGILPEGADPSNGGMMVFGGRAGAAGARRVAPQIDVDADLAFFIDPATQRVHQLRIKSYTKGGAMAFRVVVAGAGAAPAGEDEESDDEETDTKAPLQFKNGLPVRRVKKDQTSVNTYDVKLKDHGKATLPELDESAKALLGIGAPK